MQSNSTFFRRVFGYALLVLSTTTAGAVVQAADNRNTSPLTSDDELPAAGSALLYVHAIEGVTAGRHLAPAHFSVPVGTELVLEQTYTRPGETVWEGADELEGRVFSSLASRRMDREGRYIIRAWATVSGRARLPVECVVDVIKTPLQDLSPLAVNLHEQAARRDELMSNAETMAHYFGNSIATIESRVVPGARSFKKRTGRVGNYYVTSIHRVVSLDAVVRGDAAKLPTEWRVDGVPVGLGTVFDYSFDTVGRHTVAVGPVAAPNRVTVETYEAKIVSHVSTQDIVPEGEWITFRAETNPPGFEDRITWIASTKFGSSNPIWGQGPSFTVRFDNTWGEMDGAPFQWLGAKADNMIFNQDQKAGACCLDDVEACFDATEVDCVSMDGLFQGLATNCSADDCEKKTVEVRLLRLTGPAGSGIDSMRTPNAAGASNTLNCLVDCLNSVYGDSTRVCFSACDTVEHQIPANTDGMGGNEIDNSGDLDATETLAIRNYLYSDPGGIDLVPKGKIVIATVGNFDGTTTGRTFGFGDGTPTAACNQIESNDNLSFVEDAGDCRTFAHEVAHSFCLCHCVPASNIMTSPRASAIVAGEIPIPPVMGPCAGTTSGETAFSAAHRTEVRRKACDPSNQLCEAMAPPSLIPAEIHVIECEQAESR